jgi:hypothetical protein
MFCMPQAAETRHMNVPNAGFLERVGQRVPVKLRVVSRAWNRPNIDNERYPVRFEERDKFVERASRMSNR